MVKKIVGLKVLILPLALAFVVMFVVLYVKPAFDSMMAAKKATASGQQQLANIQSQNVKLAELKSKWETMEEKKLVQVALPDEENIDDYMAELYGRVSRSGALLTKFETKKNTSSETDPYLCGTTETGAISGAGGAVQPSGANAASSSAPAVPGASSELPSPGASPGTPLGASPAPALCANSVVVTISVSGNWEQILGLFKYLEDTNRVANIKKVVIQSKKQTDQEGESSDLLSADVTLDIFYKSKNETGNAAVMSGLASGGQFSNESLEKLKSVIFSTFEEPSVSETSERNIFK